MDEIEHMNVLRKAQKDLIDLYDEWRQSDAFTPTQCQALLHLIRETVGAKIVELHNEVEHTELFLKTVAEISQECGVHRTTLNKAIGRKAFPARRSGSILLVDDESDEFKAWLASHKRSKTLMPKARPSAENHYRES